MGKEKCYIDEDSNVHKYSNNNTQYTNTYATSSNTGNLTEISNASFGNATVESCQAACNNISDCVAINFSDGECVPLSSISEGFSNLEGYTNNNQVYTKNKVPYNAPVGLPNNIVNTDSVTFNKYLNGGAFAPAYGLKQAVAPQQSQVNILQKKLNVLTGGLSNITNDFALGTNKLNYQAKQNVKGLKKYLSDLKKTDREIENITNSSIENILTNSDIVVLQKNYNYLFWSILAIATILVAINVAKK
jgi:hypothetical protein